MKHNGANEPAFPRSETICDGQVNDHGAEGMTMREWYAGIAMSGILSNSDLPDLFKSGFAPARMVEICFACADAMLAQARK